MSGKFSALTFLGLIALAWVIHTHDSTPVSEPRSQSKFARLPASKVFPLRYTQKIRGPISTKLSVRGNPPSGVGDVFVVVGEILSETSLANVHYEFNLPPEIELINGQVSGEVNNLEANVTHEVVLTVKQLTDGNRQIHLVANSSNQGMMFADSTQLNTLLEEAFRAGTKELLDSTKENLPQYKVFH